MKTIGFIGLGLIGGSIAKTIRKFHPDYHILAYAKHKETLAAALNCNAIDAVLEEKDERYHTCDYIFLCAPVEYNIEYLKYLKKNLVRPTDETCAQVKGKVVLTFLVNKEGRPFYIKVKESLCESADKEAIRLIQEGPDWIYGNKLVEVTVKFE